MKYIDGFVAAVPADKKAEYLEYAQKWQKYLKVRSIKSCRKLGRRCARR